MSHSRGEVGAFCRSSIRLPVWFPHGVCILSPSVCVFSRLVWFLPTVLVSIPVSMVVFTYMQLLRGCKIQLDVFFHTLSSLCEVIWLYFLMWYHIGLISFDPPTEATCRQRSPLLIKSGEIMWLLNWIVSAKSMYKYTHSNKKCQLVTEGLGGVQNT